MRFLTQEEGRDWLASGEHPIPTERPPAWIYSSEGVYRLPGDAGKRTALARTLSALASQTDSSGMLWITGYGIWPSSENRELFYVLRRSLGESRLLNDVPCHLFDQSDTVGLECLLDLVLYFFWDATLYLVPVGIIVRLSHDEVMELYSNSASEFVRISEDFKRLKLEEM